MEELRALTMKSWRLTGSSSSCADGGKCVPCRPGHSGTVGYLAHPGKQTPVAKLEHRSFLAGGRWKVCASRTAGDLAVAVAAPRQPRDSPYECSAAAVTQSHKRALSTQICPPPPSGGWQPGVAVSAGGVTLHLQALGVVTVHPQRFLRLPEASL